MFSRFLYFLEEETQRRNTTYPVVVGLYGGMLFNWVLFTAAWIALVTTMDPMTFLQQDMRWYTKVLAGFGYLAMGGLSAFMYGEMTSAAVAWLFGFYTMKTRSLGPKVVLFFILGLLMFGLFPYLAMVGFIALRMSFSDVGMLDPTGLLVGGLFVTVLGVIIPGLLSDPQTLGQKRAIVITRLLEAAQDAAEDEVRNNPALALRIVGVNEFDGGVITDRRRLLDMLKPYPDMEQQARRLMANGDVALNPQFPENPELYFRHQRHRPRPDTIEGEAKDTPQT